MREWQDEPLYAPPPSPALSWQQIEHECDQELRNVMSSLLSPTVKVSQEKEEGEEEGLDLRDLFEPPPMQMSTNNESWSSLMEPVHVDECGTIRLPTPTVPEQEVSVIKEGCWWNRFSKFGLPNASSTDEWVMQHHKGLVMLVASNVAIFALGFLLGRRSAPTTPLIQIISI